MPKAEWSGWAQAIGTVIAIFAAIWISRDQLRRQEHVRLTESRELRLIRLQALHIGIEQMEEAFRTARRGLVNGYPSESEALSAVRRGIDQVKFFNLFEIPRVELIRPIGELLAGLTQVERFLVVPYNHDDPIATLEEKKQRSEELLLDVTRTRVLCETLIREEQLQGKASRRWFTFRGEQK